MESYDAEELLRKHSSSIQSHKTQVLLYLGIIQMKKILNGSVSILASQIVRERLSSLHD